MTCSVTFRVASVLRLDEADGDVSDANADADVNDPCSIRRQS
jgi:hypothetical protein